MEYTLKTDYLERKLGLCGHINVIAIRFSKEHGNEIILTTDKDIKSRWDKAGDGSDV